MNQVCQVKSFKGAGNSRDIVSGTSVSVLIPNQFAVIAHEIGHNFGAIHDCDSRACQDCRGRDCKCCTCGPCDCKAKFVMNPESGGLNVKEFSPCSKSDICYKISAIGKCLQGKNKDGDILHTNVYYVTYTLYLIPFPFRFYRPGKIENYKEGYLW